MKIIYNLVTFLAASIIVGYAGWQTYENREVIMKNLPQIHFGRKCKCAENGLGDARCECVKCQCTATHYCHEGCKCGQKS